MITSLLGSTLTSTAVGSYANTALVGMANNAIGQVTSNPIGAVQNLVSDPAGFFSGLLSGGGTGAAGVPFLNDRNVGPAHLHGAQFYLKWRDVDALFQAYDKKSLTDYGWKLNKTPRTAQGIYKRAEDQFFASVLPKYLSDLANGKAEVLQSFADNNNGNVDFDLQSVLQYYVSSGDPFIDAGGVYINPQAPSNGSSPGSASAGTTTPKKDYTMWIIIGVVILYFFSKKR